MDHSDPITTGALHLCKVRPEPSWLIVSCVARYPPRSHLSPGRKEKQIVSKVSSATQTDFPAKFGIPFNTVQELRSALEGADFTAFEGGVNEVAELLIFAMKTRHWRASHQAKKAAKEQAMKAVLASDEGKQILAKLGY